MRHLSDGALRRLIDEPLAASEADRLHLVECAACGERSAAATRTAQVAAALLAVPDTGVNVSSALLAVRGKLGVAPAPQRAAARWGLYLRPLGRPVLVAAAVLTVAAVGVAATPSLVATLIYQPHTVVAVPVNTPDQGMIAGLPDLSKYGTTEVKPGTTSTVLTAAEAESLSKLTIPAAPADYAGKQATYQVIGKSEATFKFSAEKATAAALAAGKPAPNFGNVPHVDRATLERTTITVTMGPAVAVVYGTVDKNTGLGNLPLIVGVATAPVVTSTGASLSQLQTFLLSQPGIQGNAELTAQIKAIGDPLAAGKLVIPIPAGLATSTATTVDGVSGVMITEKTGLVRAVVWEKDDRIYAVAGHFDESQIQQRARQLHP